MSIMNKKISTTWMSIVNQKNSTIPLIMNKISTMWMSIMNQKNFDYSFNNEQEFQLFL